MSEPETLPDLWRRDAEQVSDMRRARMVCDYLAGMTDNYAIDLHRRLFSMESML
jgi:dGTPase